MKINRYSIIEDVVDIDIDELVTLGQAKHILNMSTINSVKSKVFYNKIDYYIRPDVYHGHFLIRREDLEKLKSDVLAE